jgi:Bacterial SH3 domain
MSACGIIFRFTRISSTVLIASSLIIGLLLSFPQIIQAQSLGEVVVTNRYANIRSGPSTKYRRIGRAANGERFTVTEIRAKWYRIAYQQRSGWIYGKLVRLEQVSPQEVDHLVEEVQVLSERIDRVVDKLDDAGSRLTEWMEKNSPPLPGETESKKDSKRTSRVMPVKLAWALIPGGPRLACGDKHIGWSMLAATTGSLALGLYYHNQYNDYMTDYRNLTRSDHPGEFDSVYGKARNSLRLSDGLFYAAAGLYLLNIVDYYFILPRTGALLAVEIDKSDQRTDKGQRINLSLSKSF